MQPVDYRGIRGKRERRGSNLAWGGDREPGGRESLQEGTALLGARARGACAPDLSPNIRCFLDLCLDVNVDMLSLLGPEEEEGSLIA